MYVNLEGPMYCNAIQLLRNEEHVAIKGEMKKQKQKEWLREQWGQAYIENGKNAHPTDEIQSEKKSRLRLGNLRCRITSWDK